jgi:hypothetical protein
MRTTILSIFLLLFCSYAFAQKIKGVVSDSSGKILPYASIYIKETTKGTNANSEGKYSLKTEPGTYTIVCQYVGYQRQEKKISLTNGDIELDFQLSLQGMTLGEVVIKKGEDPAYEIIRNAIKTRTLSHQILRKKSRL